MMNDNIKYGWIGLYRSISNHWLYPKDRIFTKYEAWIDILLMVNHTAKKVFNGVDTEICEIGQIFTSQKKLMSRWNWSKSKLKTFLKLLEKEQMIILKTTTKKTTIKVVNYQSYQDLKKIGKEKETLKKTVQRLQKDHEKTSKKLQKATNNNDNNNNNLNNDNKREGEKKSLSPLEIIKSDLEYWEQFQMNNKKQIDDWDKMLLDWGCKVDEEGLKYDFKILKARLERYTRNWHQNQNRYKKNQEDKKTFSMNR